MKTNAELLKLCEDGDRALAIAFEALDRGVPGAKQGRLSGEVDICDLLLGRAAREALPRLIAENEGLRDLVASALAYAYPTIELQQRMRAALKEQTP